MSHYIKMSDQVLVLPAVQTEKDTPVPSANEAGWSQHVLDVV
jgi:hypothetical protein